MLLPTRQKSKVALNYFHRASNEYVLTNITHIQEDRHSCLSFPMNIYYLLPCSCSRKIPIQSRQAGEIVTSLRDLD